ncbi:hypothetical protein OE88DRAFT_856198 [Heliocybe sulcata]|uniref:F-box domain-containing protein n=1 Tax=Heliocybe sulcata TaxID=5364 RepID=A0A5C3MMU8_9AGAM|nr:hypothetical protein OE88DRAFT_856198 [Heliocybe sulcata]
MHPALTQQDILRIVFEYIQNDYWREIAFFNISLVCRAFKEPALDALWHELRSLTPLLKLVPVIRKADWTYELPDNIAPRDLDRFKCHARRVKKLVYRECLQKEKAWFPILVRLPDILDGPILPYLRTMQWFVAEEGGPLSHAIIARPLATLESATIQFDTLYSSRSKASEFALTRIDWFVKTLATNAPWLTRLLLKNLPKSFALSFSQFARLQSLTFTCQVLPDQPFTTPQHFASMSTITGLTFLKLNLHEFSAPNGATCQFHSLNSVHLIGTSDAVVSVIPSLRPSPITVFFVELVGNNAALASLFNNITSITFQALVHLTIKYNPCINFPEWKGSDLLPSLLTCTKLLKCDIHLNDVTVALTQDDIFSMARSWPLIEELRWNCKVKPLLSVRSLQAFVKYSPSLRVLGIPVCTLPPFLAVEDYEYLPVSTHKLRQVEIYTPFSENYFIECAQWLVVFFPYLDKVRISGDEDDDLYAVHRAVKRLQFMKKLWAWQAARESGQKDV